MPSISVFRFCLFSPLPCCSLPQSKGQSVLRPSCRAPYLVAGCVLFSDVVLTLRNKGMICDTYVHYDCRCDYSHTVLCSSFTMYFVCYLHGIAATARSGYVNFWIVSSSSAAHHGRIDLEPFSNGSYLFEISQPSTGFAYESRRFCNCV